MSETTSTETTNTEELGQLNRDGVASVETPAEAPRRRSGFHPVNIWHLVMGVLFLVFVAGWIVLINQPEDNWDDLRWMLPLPWIAAGGIGLVVAAVRSIRRHH